MQNKLFTLFDALIARERSIENTLASLNGSKNEGDFFAAEFDLLEEMLVYELFPFQPRVCATLLENSRDAFWDYEDGKINRDVLLSTLNSAARNIEKELNAKNRI